MAGAAPRSGRASALVASMSPLLRGHQASISEAAFQRQVTDLAALFSWEWFHDFDSRRNSAGFPDLVLVRGGRLVFAELKTQAGVVRPDQRRWLRHLAGVDGVETYVWRPDDLAEIQGVLR